MPADADLSAERYLKERVDDQIAWHSRKSAANKMMYRTLTTINIAAAALIPFLSAFALILAEDSAYVRALPVIAGGVGVLLTVSSGILTVYRFHENWVDFRLIAESLRREKYLYLARAEPYDAAPARGRGPGASFALLVERVEGLIARTTVTWSNNARRKIFRPGETSPAPPRGKS